MASAPVRINYIRHLNAFFAQVRKDHRLHAQHISLYMALFYTWNRHHFHTSFPVLREEIMRLSRIGSRNTYTMCMKHLHACGYICYQQAAQLFAPATISMCPIFETLKGPGTETLSVPDQGHIYYKQINKIKQEEKKALSPPLAQVQAFFNANAYPETEASKFFHHYEANGWRQGGRAPITNWQAAAHKWVLNIHPTKPKGHEQYTPAATKLHCNQNKSYTDPL
ncbi:hypothetical protein [Chitinophaga vietnamensis]|uniref:hypothetical protein n=1 Tax=Chitinophaga vietnamensis TaxID=2593957 RepID=UPI001375F644|nr:hypothetical protein [Chitinophaga vietnamensis]